MKEIGQGEHEIDTTFATIPLRLAELFAKLVTTLFFSSLSQSFILHIYSYSLHQGLLERKWLGLSSTLFSSNKTCFLQFIPQISEQQTQESSLRRQYQCQWCCIWNPRRQARQVDNCVAIKQTLPDGLFRWQLNRLIPFFSSIGFTWKLRLILRTSNLTLSFSLPLCFCIYFSNQITFKVKENGTYKMMCLSSLSRMYCLFYTFWVCPFQNQVSGAWSLRWSVYIASLSLSLHNKIFCGLKFRGRASKKH